MKIQFQSSLRHLFRFLTLPLALLMLSFSVQAEVGLSGTYFGLQFADATMTTENSIETTKISYGHLKAKYGWVMNEIVSLEGQLGFTNNPEDTDSLMVYGAYLRAGKDFGGYKLYGLLGVGGIYTYEADNKESESSGSYGVGLEIFGSPDVAITLEYLTVLDKSVDAGDLTLGSLGFGFTYYFSEEKSYFDKNRNKIKSIRY